MVGVTVNLSEGTFYIWGERDGKSFAATFEADHAKMIEFTKWLCEITEMIETSRKEPKK